MSVNDTEKKVIELEMIQKSHSAKLGELKAESRDFNKRINKLVTANESHTQQIEMLIWVTKLLTATVFLAVLGAIFKAIFP